MEGVFCFEKSKTLLKIWDCKTDFKPRGFVLENKNLQKDLLSKLELISKLFKTSRISNPYNSVLKSFYVCKMFSSKAISKIRASHRFQNIFCLKSLFEKVYEEI